MYSYFDHKAMDIKGSAALAIAKASLSPIG
jgi:hypothetical protein